MSDLSLATSRLLEIADGVLAAQKAERLRCSLCSCCGKPLEAYYALPTECVACLTGETFD